MYEEYVDTLLAVLMGSELSSDDSQSDITIESYRSDDEKLFTKEKTRNYPEIGTVLKLNSTTISQYLKPFKSLLTDISHLIEYPELAPYITTPTLKKCADQESSSGCSSINGDEDDCLHTMKRRRLESTTKVAQYPPTNAQNEILKQLRQAHTLVFTALPSADCILKLIALSIQVARPFFHGPLFPNVDKVVFSSTMQEKSIDDRYALLGTHSVLPHPITFALDWLVNDFTLCIHGISSTSRTKWIDNCIKKYRGDLVVDELRDKYEKEWNLLNPLGGTVDIDMLPRLRSVSYHNILPGDRPMFSQDLETYLYFGRHEQEQAIEAEDTIHFIAEILLRSMLLGLTSNRVHLYNIEYLEHAISKKFGPKARDLQWSCRKASITKLCRLVFTLGEGAGVPFDFQGKKTLTLMLGGEEYKAFDGVVCPSCGPECEEISCSKLRSIHYRVS